jgi:hypothetical protein
MGQSRTWQTPYEYAQCLHQRPHVVTRGVVAWKDGDRASTATVLEEESSVVDVGGATCEHVHSVTIVAEPTHVAVVG